MAAEPSETGSTLEHPPPLAAAAVALGSGGPNPCCAKLWKKYQKLETTRTALREGVKLLQMENDKLQKEISALSKVCNEEHLRGDSAEAAKETESDARDLLEKEIIELKAQNSALQQTQNICKNDNDILRISELEEENRRLKQVIEEERMRSKSEKKKVEEEKSKALEMQKILKSETRKSEEYKRLIDTERKIANDLKASCEKYRSEANESRAQLAAQIQKTGEAHKRAEAEKQKAAREQKRADSEKSLAEKNKKLIEVERRKVMEEKSRSDHLFAKLEEQKKLNEKLQVSTEAQRKNAMFEKNRADHLLQKLEEERKRTEYSQRKSDDLCVARDMISFGKRGRHHVDVVTESANVKLLKKKLKLKKDQLKHVENVLKLDEAKFALVRREFQHLKQDWIQPLSRFNMLDDLLAGGVEGIHVLTELKRQLEVHDFEQDLLPHNPVAAPYFGLQARMVPFSSSTPREYTSYQLPRESCTRPISGTSSELEPPVGSALRTKSNSHHRSSCPTSISDKKFMGSQGKQSLFVSSADIRENRSSAVPELPPKGCNDTRKQDDRALLGVSGDSSRRKALKLSLSNGTEIEDKMLSGGRKRKRTKKSIESAASLSSKHDVLNLKTNGHNATTNDVSTFNDDHSYLQHGNNIMPRVTEHDLQNHQRNCHAVADKFPSFDGLAKVPSPGAGNACAGSKFSSLLSFEKLIKGDCLKLLNLDNDADEEKFRKAVETPLSPDLPIVEPTITKRPIYNESCYLVDGNDFGYDRGCPASRSDGNLLEVEEPASRSDGNLLEVEEPSNRILFQNGKLESSYNRIEHGNNNKELCANEKSNAAVNISCNTKLVDPSAKVSLCGLPRGHEDLNSVASLAEESDNTIKPLFSESTCSCHANAVLNLCKPPNKNRLNQIGDTSSDPGLRSVVDTSNAQTATPINLTCNSMIEHRHGGEKTAVYFVGAISMKRSTIIKILQYWETLISEARKPPKDVFVDGLLLERVLTEPLLLPEERVSLIFSLLLWDVCRLTTDPVADEYFASSAFSMSVKSYMETRWIFLESNQLDVLVSLIEDFLVHKEVVVCDKMGERNCDASKNSDETGIQVSTKPATIDQFISACVLLASICVKVERVDVVLEVSYKVLQAGKRNLSWTMLALHVFGSICGDKLLFLKSCNFLRTTIRLVVMLLESTDTSVCLGSTYIQLNRPTAFPSCTHCLFDVDTISIDAFISSLLDELDLCSLLWNDHANSNEAITRHSSHLGSGGLAINCGEPCMISKQAKVAEDSHKTHNYLGGRDLCYFAEIVSLLELFGSYMSCEWTYNNVVVRLLNILESCTCEEYSAAILVLISQIGRFFIDDVGYETKSVSEMRNKLSVLMGTSFTRSRSIPVQFSAIGALLSLLPLTFDKIVATQSGPLSGPCFLQASQISEWFAQLSKENQSFARSFFS